MMTKRPLFTFKSLSVHILIIPFIMVGFTVAFAMSHNELVRNISYIVLGALSLFLFVECIYLSNRLNKEYKQEVPSFKERLKNIHYREEMFAPLDAFVASMFALIHYVVFVYEDGHFWYFSLLCGMYLIGISLKAFMAHVEENDDKEYYPKLVVFSNIATLIVSLFIFSTLFWTHYFHDVLSEPLYLLILEIVFFALKAIFVAIDFFNLATEKTILKLSHALLGFTLASYTGYSMTIGILHMNHVLSPVLIWVVGIIFFSPVIIGNIIMVIRTLKNR